jgi:hypothetical protein
VCRWRRYRRISVFLVFEGITFGLLTEKVD